MQICPLSLLSVLVIATTVYAKDGCMRVIGRLVCDNNQTMAKGVEIDLMDLDGLFWETDDIMGKTWSSTEDGTFTVAGCGSDAGPWNTVDPYLKMTHNCRGKSETINIGIWPTFLPSESNVGRIRLDDDN